MFKTEEALAMIGGHVDEELLLRNEYLAIENEILRNKNPGRIVGALGRWCISLSNNI